MRLIDADELLTRIRLNYNNHQNISAGAMKDIINTTKTAYDIEKVQEEIKEQFGCKDCEYVDEFQHPACNECAEFDVIDDICNIVKRGGIDG